MSKYVDIEKIRAEIKRRVKELENDNYISTSNKTSHIAELHYMDRFLDTLQDEVVMHTPRYAPPQPEKHNALFDKCVENADLATMKEVSDNVDKLLQEQDTLPGAQEGGIPGKDYIPVEWVDACEQYGKWKIVKVEPEVDFPKIKGWVARDKDGTLVWYSQKPEREIVNFEDVGLDEHVCLNPNFFPELTWGSDPLEVELIIKPIKK